MKNKRDAVIVSALRTPMGKKKGAFADTRPDELVSQLLRSLVQQMPIAPNEIENVKIGCVTQTGEQGGRTLWTGNAVRGARTWNRDDH